MSIETWTIPFEAYIGNDPYIFVSYAHKDKSSVYPDLRVLNDRGYRIWYDEGIDPGNEWAEEVAKALKSCSVFIVFISPNAMASENVRDEIHFARSNKANAFLPIHIEQTKLPPGIELRTAAIQAILRYKFDPEIYFRKLERVLTSFSTTLKRDIAFADVIAETALLKTPLPDSDTISQFSVIEQLGRQKEWKQIRELGPHCLSTMLIELMNERDSLSTSMKLINLGVYLTDAGSFVLAKKCFDAVAKRFLEYIGNNGESLLVLDHLGMVYNNLGRLVRMQEHNSRVAESFYRKSLEIFETIYPSFSDDPDLGDRLGMVLINYGNVLSAQGKSIAARESYEKGLELYRQIAAEHPGNVHIKQRLVDAKSLLDSHQ